MYNQHVRTGQQDVLRSCLEGWRVSGDSNRPVSVKWKQRGMWGKPKIREINASRGRS